MIDHPFLSFKDLSDDELLEKSTELHRNLNRAHLWGSSPDLINQLQWMLEMIEEEKMERLNKQAFDAFNDMFPERVESDPEFKVAKGELEETKTTVIKPAKVSKPQTFTEPVFNKEYSSNHKPKK